MTDILQVGPLMPAFAPGWADVFGEDAYGIFAELEVNGIRFVWRWIPPGRFKMGSPEGEKGRQGYEGPRHEVMLTHGFWLGETPVTQEQWEYACRAGQASAFNDGSDCIKPTGKDPALLELAWFDENSGSETRDVKGKRCNGWGLYDMHGNVWEWCRDGRRDYEEVAVDNPVGPEAADAYRVARGGAWLISAQSCRSAFRFAAEPGYRWNSRGLRLAAGQPPEAGSGAAEPPGAERPTG